MRVHSCITAIAGLSACVAALAQPPATQPFDELAAQCAPDIHPATLKAVVTTESSWNPYAIGIVGGKLERQPRSLDEAVATARELEREGFNFSLGLGQVNRHNLTKHGETYATVFEPCRNLRVGAAILKDCFQRAKRTISDEQSALRAAFSCYYSGNFTRGFRVDSAGQPSYVQKVVANASGQARSVPVVPEIEPRNSDRAIAVRSSARPVEARKPAQSPSAWVFFAESVRQRGPAEVQRPFNAANESAVKVRRLIPTRYMPPSVPAELLSVSVTKQEPASQAEAENNDLQDAPFVQFIH